MKNKPKRDNQSAVKEPADQENSEETLAALEELTTGKKGAPGRNNGGEQEVLPDEELDALEELVGKVQASEEEMDENDSSSDELLALEQLLEVETTDKDDPGSPVSDLSSMDEELAALEELVEVTPAKKEKSLAGMRAASEEDRALDDLTDAGAFQGDRPLRQEETTVGQDDGVITLKEVVSLGRASEQSRLSPAQKKQRPSSRGPASTQKKSSVSSNGGLSEEEQDDLETLIKGFREETSSGVTAAVVTDLQTQIHALQKRVMLLSKMMAKLDGKILAFGEVLRLQHKKTKLMNRRIDRIASEDEEE